MNKPEPLINCIENCCNSEHCDCKHFDYYRVKSAVEWLKRETEKCKIPRKYILLHLALINVAFEDVIDDEQ